MKHGFSLVELSIVLVILGLLVGGIMTGQNLIRAAELRSVSTELNQWQSAVNLFKDKYFKLPGDMDNATKFWNDEGNCTAVEASTHTVALVNGTCDGNGTGKIGNNDAVSGRYELFLFWHHLQLAGLIPGQYSGVMGTNSRDHILGENAPRAKMSNGGWSAWSFDKGLGTRFDLEYGNMFQLGSANTPSFTEGQLLTPEEAWNIDTKMDDGKPAQGNIIAQYWNNACAAASSNTDFDADYNLSEDSIQCSLHFRNAM